MAVTTAILSAAAIATTIGTTVYSVEASKSAQKKATEAGDRQASQAAALQNEATQRSLIGPESPAAQQSTVTAAKDRAKQKARAATGTRDTILTSPLGVPGQAPATQKTLLGQ